MLLARSLRVGLILMAASTMAGTHLAAQAGKAPSAPTKPVAGASAQSADKLPRYKLEVGQELTYESRGRFRYIYGSIDKRTIWQIWVAAANADGSWRLIIHHTYSDMGMQRLDGKSGKADSVEVVKQLDALLESEEKMDSEADAHLITLNLFPDGRIIPPADAGAMVEPQELLIRLPETSQAAEQGWEQTDSSTDVQRRYELTPPPGEGGTWRIRVSRSSPYDKVYDSTSESQVWFNADRGLVERIETESTQGYLFGDGRETEVTVLKSVRRHDPVWYRSFLEDTDRYFDATEAYQEHTGRAEKSPNGEAIRASAAAKLQQALKATRNPIVRQLLKTQLADHDSSVAFWRDIFQKRRDVVGHPAPAFETTDLKGKSHKLTDYHGKVVILDFWYRGCGWCITGMPQMRQVAAHFTGQPVAVLGMNTDDEPKDAEHVVATMQLNYPNLKAEGIAKQFKVDDFPTLIIIDQQGTVHDMHIGYSPTLAEEVIETVEGLLRNPPTEHSPATEERNEAATPKSSPQADPKD